MTPPSGPSVAALLAHARELRVPRLDAQLLLAHRLGRSRTWLLAHEDDAVSSALANTCRAELAQLAEGLPLAYLLGRKEFHGLELKVSPAVLIPRPDTETLVAWALEHIAQCTAPHPRVADLGTGSGAIALAVKRDAPQVQMWATDRSAAALAVAQENAAALGLAVHWREGDWWQALQGEPPFDLVLSNPPYIAEGDPHLAALQHEPRSALTSGPDGLDDLRRLLAGAQAHLVPGGALLLEHGWDQAPAVAALVKDHGLEDLGHRADLAGHWRCTGGRRPA